MDAHLHVSCNWIHLGGLSRLHDTAVAVTVGRCVEPANLVSLLPNLTPFSGIFTVSSVLVQTDPAVTTQSGEATTHPLSGFITPLKYFHRAERLVASLIALLFYSYQT